MISPNEHPVASLASIEGSFDLKLIRKYAIPSPRYTSYPPATQFHSDFNALKLEQAVQEDNRAGAGPISLYFHLPFCQTRCWFCGCTSVITQRTEAAAEYLDYLEIELRLMAEHLDCKRPVAQLHLGGGTPTFFPPEQLRQLGELLRERFHYSPDAEISVEIDPRRLTLEHVQALRELGVNRASLGIQDTNPKVQLAIHRFQPNKLNQQAFDWLRAEGFKSINVDLIYGLPLQTAASFGHTLDDVVALNPDRLSVFNYAHVPWIRPAQRIFETRGELPPPEQRLAMFAESHARLAAAGYHHIGLDHFARPGDELAQALANGTLQRNFQGYSTHAGASLYSFGMSAISRTANTYRQNFRELRSYRESLSAGQLPTDRGYRLTDEDCRRRAIVMSIMCNRRLDYAALSRELGVKFTEAYASEIGSLADLEADGLIKRTADGLTVTPAGVPLLRIVAMRFDAYLAPSEGRHAQTI
jgi:oxygen-independent coproporphyrinogen-3 oxidase